MFSIELAYTVPPHHNLTSLSCFQKRLDIMLWRILFLFLLVSYLSAEEPKLNSRRPVSRKSARQPPLAKPSQSQPTESSPKKESTFGQPGSKPKKDLPKPKWGTTQRNAQIRPPSDSPPSTPPTTNRRSGSNSSSSRFGSSPLHRKDGTTSTQGLSPERKQKSYTWPRTKSEREAARGNRSAKTFETPTEKISVSKPLSVVLPDSVPWFLGALFGSCSSGGQDGMSWYSENIDFGFWLDGQAPIYWGGHVNMERPNPRYSGQIQYIGGQFVVSNDAPQGYTSWNLGKIIFFFSRIPDKQRTVFKLLYSFLKVGDVDYGSYARGEEPYSFYTITWTSLIDYSVTQLCFSSDPDATTWLRGQAPTTEFQTQNGCNEGDIWLFSPIFAGTCTAFSYSIWASDGLDNFYALEVSDTWNRNGLVLSDVWDEDFTENWSVWDTWAPNTNDIFGFPALVGALSYEDPYTGIDYYLDNKNGWFQPSITPTGPIVFNPITEDCYGNTCYLPNHCFSYSFVYIR